MLEPLKKNKKAQIGETLTWIVATLIIIGILLIFIYASLALAKSKSLNSIKVREHANSLIGVGDDDWIESKNEMAFIRSSENKQKVVNWINEKQLNEEELIEKLKESIENEN